MRKKLALLGAASALALTPLTAAPAHAATWDRCPSGYFCLFDGANGTGTMAWFRWGSPDLRGQSMDNRASSFWNRTSNAWSLTDGYNYTGQCFSVFSTSPGNMGSTWNNRVSSLYAPGGDCA